MPIFNKKIEDLLKNNFVKNVSVLAGGTGLAQLLLLAASPIITRIFTPEDFGTLAIFIAMLAALGSISSLRYHLAIPLPEKDEDAIQILVLAISLNMIFGFLVALLLYLVSPILEMFENISVIIPYLWMISISVVVLGFYQSLRYWAIRESKFNYIAQTHVTQNISLIVAQIGLGLLFSGPIGLLIGDAIGRSSGSGTLAWQAKDKIIRLWPKVDWASIKTQAVRYKRFPIYSTGSGFFNSLGLQITPLLIVGILGPIVAGFYTLTQKVSGAPLKLVGESYGQVYYKEAANRLNNGEGLSNFFLKQSKILLLIGLVPVLILLILGENGFAFIFGDKWGESGIYAQILSPMLLVQFVVVPLSQTLNIIERQDIQLIWDTFRLIIISASFLVIYHFSFDAELAIGMISISMLLMYLILYVVIYRYIDK